MYRLYVDEVGTDCVDSLESDDSRFLSLTGIAMKVSAARDDLEPKLDWIKTNVFDHDPDEPLILHRRKIMQRKSHFGVLNDPAKSALFDKATLRLMKVCDYKVITAVIDKLEASKKSKWREKHPYHYLMQIMTEKFARYLDRVGSFGDIMPEARMGKKDEHLQSAYDAVRTDGLYYYSPAQICYRIPSAKLKFRYKKDNVAGLQLADLIAHPSHMSIRARRGHEVQLGKFAKQVETILLASKCDRSATGTISGYGVKYLPS
jgi:hypothetical protein